MRALDAVPPWVKRPYTSVVWHACAGHRLSRDMREEYDFLLAHADLGDAECKPGYPRDEPPQAEMAAPGWSDVTRIGEWLAKQRRALRSPAERAALDRRMARLRFALAPPAHRVGLLVPPFGGPASAAWGWDTPLVIVTAEEVRVAAPSIAELTPEGARLISGDASGFQGEPVDVDGLAERVKSSRHHEDSEAGSSALPVVMADRNLPARRVLGVVLRLGGARIAIGGCSDAASVHALALGERLLAPTTRVLLTGQGCSLESERRRDFVPRVDGRCDEGRLAETICAHQPRTSLGVEADGEATVEDLTCLLTAAYRCERTFVVAPLWAPRNPALSRPGPSPGASPPAPP